MYFGKITEAVYQKALELRGDDECCWEEKVPLAGQPHVLGPSFGEEMDGDTVIEIWEAALEEAEEEAAGRSFSLDHVTIRLEESGSSMEGEFYWEKHVRFER